MIWSGHTRESTLGMEKTGPGRLNQQMVMDHLTQEVQLITNDVRILSLISLTSEAVLAFQAMLRSRKTEASDNLDLLTLSELVDVRDAAVDFAILCRKKILERG